MRFFGALAIRDERASSQLPFFTSVFRLKMSTNEGGTVPWRLRFVNMLGQKYLIKKIVYFAKEKQPCVGLCITIVES
ncbi:MAG: hypothetical protein Q8P82_03010 [bacterium]|nr:hypothetical protein [bacterium]